MSVPGKKEKEENAEVTPIIPTREEYSSNFFQNLYSDTKNFLGNQFPFGGPLIDKVNLEIDKKAFPKKYFGTMDEQGKKSNTDNGIKVEQLTNDNNISNSETTLTPEKISSNINPPEVSIRKKYDLMSPTMIGGLGESAPKINIPTADEMKASGKKSSDKRMKLYDDSINTSKSRNRMGLFGNYGKDVTIKKTSNEVTGKVNREKFVDGKLVKSRFNNQEFKASKSKGNKNARQNRKNR
tara:strand:+ start:45 stop:761 length:717 start_codon:yes stop_codon:yes gene_type:complete